VNGHLLGAAILCGALAVGHTVIGNVWVLPRIPAGVLPRTPFGAGETTSAFLYVTWHILGIVLVGLGGILLVLAGLPRLGDAAATVVHAIGATFAAATALVLWQARRRPMTLLRAPMWVAFVVIAGLCWIGASV
jgi:hypothetical protein